MKTNAFLKFGATATLALALGTTLTLKPQDASAKGLRREHYDFVQVQDKQYLKDTNHSTDWNTKSIDIKKLWLEHTDITYWQITVDKNGVASLPGKYQLFNANHYPVEADMVLTLPAVNNKNKTTMSVHIDKEGKAVIAQPDKSLPQGEYAFVPKAPRIMALYDDESNFPDLGYKNTTMWKNPDFATKRNNNNLLIDNIPLLTMERFNAVANNAHKREAEFDRHSEKIMAYFTGVVFILMAGIGVAWWRDEKKYKAQQEIMGEKISLHTDERTPANHLIKPEDRIQSIRHQAINSANPTNILDNKL